MKRWIAALLACALIAGEVQIPVLAQTPDETGLQLETELLTENEGMEETGETELPQETDATPTCDHQYEIVVTEPSCTAGGYTTYTCSLCGESYEADQTQPIDCKLETVAPVPATCKEEGVKGYYMCIQCQAQYWDAEGAEPVANAEDLVIPQTTHQMGDWEITTPSTPEELGTMTRQCQNCDEEESVEALPLEQTLVSPKVEVKYDAKTGQPILSWKPVTGALRYWIYLEKVEEDPEDDINEDVPEEADVLDDEDETLGEWLETTEKLEYIHKEAKAGEVYRYWVIAVNETACSAACEVENVSPKCLKPVLKVSRDSETGKPMLSWAAVEGAKAYEIYRSTNKKTYTLIATVEETSYLEVSAVVDKTYQYKLKAVGVIPEANSADSSVISHTCDCARPVPVAAPGASGGIKISWAKVTGGKKYSIYRSTTETGTYKYLATTTGLSYTDTKATKNRTYYYKVDVYGASKTSFSDYSEPVSATNHTFGAWKTIVPATPDTEGWQERSCTRCGEVEGKIAPVLRRSLATPSLTVKNDAASGKPVLSWGAVKNATKYQVYQVDESTGERIFLVETTAKTYTHKEAELTQKYTYMVIAVNNTQCSNYSANKSIVCICARPVLKVIRDSETGKPMLSWAEVEGAKSYEIYSSTNKKTYTLLATVEEASYLVENAVVDKTWYYQVKAVGEATGTDSAKSAVVSHVCDCARPVAAATYGENGGIKISWEKVTGGKKYTVYRSSTEHGTYTKVGTTTGLSYTDTKAPKNKVSYYKVDVYGASTASYSDYSLPVSALNHTFSAWKTIIPSTPESEGLKERTCTGCGHLESRVTPVLSRVLATPSLTVKNDVTSGKPIVSWGAVKNATKYQVYQVNESTGERIFLEEVSTKTYTHKTAQTGQTYTYSVIAVNNTQCSNYSANKSIACICARPVLKVTRDSETGKPMLSWAEVEGAVSYGIYYSTNNKTFTLLATVEDPFYLVENAVVDKKIYYKARAISANSTMNSYLTGAISHVCDCARPVATATYGENGGIKISWEKVTGGKKYTVYRSSTEHGTYTKVGTTTGLSYTDTKAPKNKVSYYKVDVYGAATASYSDYSLPVSALNHTFSAWKTIIPSTPESEGLKERICTGCGHLESRVTPVLSRVLATPSLTVKNDVTSGKPIVSWGAVKNATKYQVYQVNESTGERIFLEEVGTKTYTHKTAETGQTYTYAVIAVNNTQCSNYSTNKSILCKCAVPGLSFTPEPKTGKPVINWSASQGAEFYEIYRSSNSKSGFQLIATTEETSYTVADAAADVTRYYKIKALGATEDVNSTLSAAYGWIGDCAVPEPVAESGATTGIRISWEKVAGARKYNVYRASQEEGPYTKIATATTNSYTDTKAPKNKVSYYQISALGNNAASLSENSETVSYMNHTFTAWRTTVPSTPTEEGWQERTCTLCQHVEGKVKPVLTRSLTKPNLTVSAKNTSGKPVLSWGSVKNATEYWIYLCGGEGEEDIFLGATTERTYTYSQALVGETYAFRVMAVSATACSDFSAQKTVVCKCAVPVLQLSNDPDSGLIVATWEAVEGAGTYGLYLYNQELGEYKLYTTTSELSVTVKGAPGGKSNYKIAAYHESNAQADSELSAIYSCVGPCPAPVVYAGYNSSTANKVYWHGGIGASSYNVYRATEIDGPYKKIATTKRFFYLDKNLPADRGTYYYQVEATNTLPNTLGERSAPVAAEKRSSYVAKVYVSPSSQYNRYYYGNTTEQGACRSISIYLVEALERNGFLAMTNVSQEMNGRMPESNAWGANLHIPLHTNASNGKKQGTQIYYKKAKDKKVCQAIFDRLAPAVDGDTSDSVRVMTDLYEINACRGHVAYIEAAFHDSPEGAKWILEHKREIAEAICHGVCDYYGVPYIGPEG